MNMGRRSAPAWAAAMLVLTVAGQAVSPPAAAGPTALAGLQPGEQVDYAVQVPVNLVFLGDWPVDHDEVAAELPAEYEPVVTAKAIRGIESRPIGLRYEFDYRFVDAGAPVDERFFGYLTRIGRVGERTPEQAAYNAQDNNRLDVDERVLHLDARRVERWLDTQGRAALGIGQDSYTVFFVNWYGRPDFQFHVYTREVGADPDTGVSPEPLWLTAWGGDRAGSWFFDPSAGPNAYGGSANVDDTDLTGDGEADYRIPAAWEYHGDGFRDPGQLSGDVGKVTRYVAINQLFTPSPVYDPMFSTPRPGGDKIVQLHLWQDLPGGNGIDLVQPEVIRDRLAALQPYHDWRAQVDQTNPIDPEARHSVELWAEFWRTGQLPDDPGCWQPFGHTNAQLWCFLEANRDRYFPAYGEADYQARGLLIDIRDEVLSGNGGYADHNWQDRTQAYVVMSSSPDAREAEGRAFTGLTLHEFAHHFGLPHTYDGWDSEQQRSYFAAGETLFVDLGSQAHTVMGDWFTIDFSRFEFDNLARWETAGHLNAANALAALVLDHPRAGQVRSLVDRADRQASIAQDRLADWDHDAAVRAAMRSYAHLVTAANVLGIAPVTG
jgi:hypothetical protein